MIASASASSSTDSRSVRFHATLTVRLSCSSSPPTFRKMSRTSSLGGSEVSAASISSRRTVTVSPSDCEASIGRVSTSIALVLVPSIPCSFLRVTPNGAHPSRRQGGNASSLVCGECLMSQSDIPVSTFASTPTHTPSRHRARLNRASGSRRPRRSRQTGRPGQRTASSGLARHATPRSWYARARGSPTPREGAVPS